MRDRTVGRFGPLFLVVCLAWPLASFGESPDPAPDLKTLINAPSSELASVVSRFSADNWALMRRYDSAPSKDARERRRSFLKSWQKALKAIDATDLGVEGRIDLVLLENRLAYELGRLDLDEAALQEIAPIIPFAREVVALQEARRRLEDVEPQAAAAALVKIRQTVNDVRKAIEGDNESEAGEESAISATKNDAHLAAAVVDDLVETLADWHGHFDGYDPLFSWWTKDPYKQADEALKSYARFLRQHFLGDHGHGENGRRDKPVVGLPVGREALMEDLRAAMIPYTPEELLAIGEREFEWCDREMRKAAKDLGFDNWKDALEHVKNLHVEPGQQVSLVRDLAHEAVDFLAERDLLTVPPLATEIWRMRMLSPERQKIAPFFLGGETVQVSFPTDTMTHEQKLMSMRGNNIHFSRATVHHELIPGHHLQGFMTERHMPHRRLFYTPFWIEGWALYWEMRLWDLGFPKTPEDRIGMLFWRMHRCARIVFSLKFHLGEMTPAEAIDYLVERVGHERDNATAEVRRSFEGNYPPLYQLAYMMGALQFRALHEELVVNGEMTEKAFHDGILTGGHMPVEMVRARLKGTLLEPGYAASWRFADPLP